MFTFGSRKNHKAIVTKMSDKISRMLTGVKNVMLSKHCASDTYQAIKKDFLPGTTNNSIILRGNISDTIKEKAKRGNLFTERQGIDDYIIS